MKEYYLCRSEAAVSIPLRYQPAHDRQRIDHQTTFQISQQRICRHLYGNGIRRIIPRVLLITFRKRLVPPFQLVCKNKRLITVVSRIFSYF